MAHRVPLEKINARLPTATLHRLERLRVALRARLPPGVADVSLTDALRASVERGLDALEPELLDGAPTPTKGARKPK